jgi:hypothetical protein
MKTSLFTALLVLITGAIANGCGNADVNILYDVVSECGFSSFCWSFVHKATTTKISELLLTARMSRVWD